MGLTTSPHKNSPQNPSNGKTMPQKWTYVPQR